MRFPPFHKALLNFLLSQEWYYNRIYSAMSKDLALALKKYKNKGKNVWKGNEDIKRDVQSILKKYEKIIYTHIHEQIDKGWELSNKHNDEFVNNYLKGLNLTEKQRNPYYYRNLIAREAMKHRQDDGVSLSKRVWNLTKQTQSQLDAFLLEGLADGRSAKDLQKDLRKYLKEPDKRFRRVRDENGKLVLSNPAKNYHPGRGVYRSSYKNALRLTRNEINIAYRTADHERRMAMDFVLGIEICLSPSHKIYDICDEMKGKYPKDYKFTGWHTNCLCYVKSVLMNKKDFVKYLKTKKASGYITDIPSNAKNYISDNYGKIKAMASTPYFFRDNKKFFEDLGLKGNFKQYKHYKNGGTLEIHKEVSKKTSDYKDLITIGNEFAKLGKSVKITPRLHYKSDEYEEIYGKLKGTKYYRKCPDLLIDGKFYEYESFVKPWNKKKVGRMLSHGKEQSPNIIINNNKGANDRFIKKILLDRLRIGQVIDELWIYEKGKVRLLK